MNIQKQRKYFFSILYLALLPQIFADEENRLSKSCKIQMFALKKEQTFLNPLFFYFSTSFSSSKISQWYLYCERRSKEWYLLYIVSFFLKSNVNLFITTNPNDLWMILGKNAQTKEDLLEALALQDLAYVAYVSRCTFQFAQNFYFTVLTVYN